MSGSEQPSREELLALIESQARMIEKLTARVAELERQLGRNSRNSSQPPSADGPAAPPSRATRRRSGRNPGKQPGAGGSALFQTSNPDEILDHVPATGLVVSDDGRSLAELAGTGAGPSTFDAAGLHRLLVKLQAGRWASYGDIASLVGTAAQPLGGHVRHCLRCENAWRVLQESGRPATGFQWSDPARRDTVQEVLEREGVRFVGDAADPTRRLTTEELRALLGAEV